jgi:hypothetical protein
MTNPACATRTGKIAKTEALRPPLQAVQPAVTGTGTPAGTHSPQTGSQTGPQTGMSALACKMPGSKRPGSRRPGSPLACVAGKEPLFALDQRWDAGTAWLTHVVPAGGETTKLRSESNGPALQFKPGGT